MPAGGTWTIGPGQRLAGASRGSFRQSAMSFRTEHGALHLPGESRVVILELELVAPDAAGHEPRTIGFAGRLVSADQSGRWRFGGTAIVDDTASPLDLTVAYQGVHTRGAAPVAWLTIANATFAVESAQRRWRRRVLQLSGDLNARTAAIDVADDPTVRTAAVDIADDPTVGTARGSTTAGRVPGLDSAA